MLPTLQKNWYLNRGTQEKQKKIFFTVFSSIAGNTIVIGLTILVYKITVNVLKQLYIFKQKLLLQKSYREHSPFGKSVHDFEYAAIKNITFIIIMLLEIVIARNIIMIMEDDNFDTVTKLIVGNTKFNRNEFYC